MSDELLLQRICTAHSADLASLELQFESVNSQSSITGCRVRYFCPISFMCMHRVVHSSSVTKLNFSSTIYITSLTLK
jgi:hypothetical protein